MRPRTAAAQWSERLREDRRETLARLAHLNDDFTGMVAASAQSNADDEHDPEGATIAFERSQVSALLDQAHNRLRELEAAETRLAEGRYGVCESCAEPIAAARLKARPIARTCLRCAAAR
ncbi:MAG: TraR/DksA family transcriptional regulator [Actinomycetota bacterium]|nr:TraR/DksA family transcriptional regulator [Actinomycetota bacterium]